MQLRTDHADQLPFLIRERLFSEIPSSVILSVAPADVPVLQGLLKWHPELWLAPVGSVTEENYIIAYPHEEAIIDVALSELSQVWSRGP